jgi:hypothetical protein
MKLLVAIAAVAVSPPVYAQSSAPSGRRVNLRVQIEPRAVPHSLGMRGPASLPAPIVAAVSPAAQAASAVVAPAAASTAAPEEAAVSYQAVPASWRDVQERVIFKVNVGYGADSAGASGELGRNGFRPQDVTDPDRRGFVDSRQRVLGDAVLGSRGVLLPSLTTYFLSQYSLDTVGGSRFAALNNVYDTRDGRALFVHAAYAEVDGYGTEGSALHKVFVRAGRQFRYGGARYVANFDGVTAGYDDVGYEISGFVGQRVSLFFADEPGILGGAGIKLRGKELLNVPVDLTADYLSFDGSVQYLELACRYDVNYSLYLRAVDPGDGMGVGRLGFRGRHAVSERLFITGQIERLQVKEVAYDILNPSAVDVVNVEQEIGIGLSPPGDSLRVGATVMALISPTLEVYGFGRANLPGSESRSSFANNYGEVGAAARSPLGVQGHVSGQYKLRVHAVDDAGTAAGSLFDDTRNFGVRQFHELSAEARYSLSGLKTSVTGGGYLRVYSFRTPYAEIDSDGRGGLRFDADYRLSGQTRIKAAGELAQPSPGLAPEIGVLTSVRLFAEASF